jgi:hypothetical protein
MPVTSPKTVTFCRFGWLTGHNSIDNSIIPGIFEESAKKRLNYTKF